MVDKLKLTPTEKKVLVAVIREPDATSTQLTKRLGISRVSISKAKKKFFDEKLIRYNNVLHLQKIGCDIFAVMAIHLNPKLMPKIKEEGVEFTIKTLAPIFSIYQETEFVNFYPAMDYAEYIEKINAVKSFYKKHQFIVGEIKETLVAVKEVKFQKVDFANIVEKLINQ